MKSVWLLALLLSVAFSNLVAAPAGSFRGVIVRAPDGEPQNGWIYVQGRNGNLRRAEVSNAEVSYAASVPIRLRDKDPQRSLTEGTEVRVTAEQDGDGEWRATHVQILKIRNRSWLQPAKRVPLMNPTPV
jgi:hypothetical protein